MGTGLARLVVQVLHVLLAQLIERAQIEARKPLDAITVDVGDEHFAIGVEPRVSDRQQKMLGAKPAAAPDDHVVGARGVGVDDEAVHIAQVFARRAFHVHSVEVDGLVIDVSGVNVPQPRLWMIHRTSSLRHGAAV